jgi:nucleotide-binding universal stress UspA family protein
MFKSILVALDGSAQSARVLPLAMSLARTSEGELHLVRVIDEGAPLEQDDEAVKSIASVNSRLAKCGFTADVRISRGQVVDQILHEAKLINADVILMSTGSHVGLAHALLGSVTEQVFARAEIPVLALSSRAAVDGDIRSILVPRDASLGSPQALSMAKSIAQSTGARIEILHVVEPLVRYFRGKYIEPDFEERTRVKSEEEMQHLASRLRELGFAAHGRAVIGQPAATVTAVADEINVDLIVMTTNGLTGLASKILGSVTHEVLRTAHAPLLLLHFSGPEALAAVNEEARESRSTPSDGSTDDSDGASASGDTLAHFPPHRAG